MFMQNLISYIVAAIMQHLIFLLFSTAKAGGGGGGGGGDSIRIVGFSINSSILLSCKSSGLVGLSEIIIYCLLRYIERAKALILLKLDLD